MKQVVGFEREVTVRQHALVSERKAQASLVQKRAQARNRIATSSASSSGCTRRSRASSRGSSPSSTHASWRWRVRPGGATPPYQAQQAGNLAVGGLGSDPSYTTPPASPYTGVVAIAMQYLGVPYV